MTPAQRMRGHGSSRSPAQVAHAEQQPARTGAPEEALARQPRVGLFCVGHHLIQQRRPVERRRPCPGRRASPRVGPGGDGTAYRSGISPDSSSRTSVGRDTAEQRARPRVCGQHGLMPGATVIAPGQCDNATTYRSRSNLEHAHQAVASRGSVRSRSASRARQTLVRSKARTPTRRLRVFRPGQHRSAPPSPSFRGQLTPETEQNERLAGLGVIEAGAQARRCTRTEPKSFATQ